MTWAPKTPSLLILFCLVGGCASTELRITVDLYDEDPRIDLPMTPREARLHIESLQVLRAEARKDISLRIDLASESVDIYRNAWRIVGQDKNRVTVLEGRLEDYSKSLQRNLRNYDWTAHAAIQALRSYVEDYQQEYRKEYRKTLKDRNDTADTVNANNNTNSGSGDSNGKGGSESCNEAENKSWISAVFTGPARTADRGDECIHRKIRTALFEKETRAMAKAADTIASFRDLGATATPFSCDWVGLEYAINAAYFAAQIKGNGELQSLLLGVGNNTTERIRSLNQSIATSGRAVPPQALRSPHTPTTLSGASLAIANELETLRNDLPVTATSREALASLVTGTSRFLEVIDRLQDPGDPIWRVITDPDNEAHWNERTVRTYFYAEGDAGVVIVRDSPLDLRVQSARNNPNALIKGQLEISRSVANAAISIAGAASGLPTDALASSSTGSQTAGEVDTSPKDFATRAAKAEAWERQQALALTSLRNYLRSLATKIAELDGDNPEELAQHSLRLKSVLNSYKPRLSIPAEN